MSGSDRSIDESLTLKVLQPTVHRIVSKWARRTPNAVAIAAPERAPLTYGRLENHIENVVGTLNSLGIGRSDRVAVVLPNSPDMAVAFLAVASGAICAPLNPLYQASELRFFISDLRAKALIIQSGIDSPAIDIAKEKGISVIQLSPMSEAGVFTFVGEKKVHQAVPPSFAKSEDTALILHTSGTTARPKIVPLTNYNICTSANSIQKTLKLKTSDCCLNIMPLFHIHGLIGAVLSTCSAGASVVCTPGFHAPKFFDWIESFRPTWYTAVPTMHQAILRHAKEEKNREILRHCRLRFIRSCSSALAPQVMVELEKAFNVPIIESYGMTEAAHQITSNPLPPLKRKPGSVGMPSGPEVAIMDERGNLLPRGRNGEIVIRGPNVTKGYENNPDANEKAFTNGWFRTGDQGYLDVHDYLTITDRIKEIINRGGEKISPREIDEVLLSHPNVAQAITFAVPNPKLGEEICAAVVLRENTNASEWDIQKFVASQLADFKVPRHVMILNEIPKGSTGKIQRIGLAEKLGLTTSIDGERRAEYIAPRTPMEKMLAELWSEVLEVDRIGVHDNFFQLGGDSIQARIITSRLCEALRIERIPLAAFLHAPTIEKMACVLGQKEFLFPLASLTAVQRTGSKPPFYCVHACEGEVLFLADLARHLGIEQPFYAFRAQGLDGKTPPHTCVEDMAAHYLKEIRNFQPEGPYFLGGVGVGGIVAWEMAQRLIAQNKKVGLLVLMDTVLPRSVTSAHYLKRILFHIKRKKVLNIARTFIRDKYGQTTHNVPNVSNYRVWKQTQKAANRYVPRIYPGWVVLFVPEKREGFWFYDDPKTRIDPWRRFITGVFNAHVIEGEHLGIFKEPNVEAMARQLRLYLAEASAVDT